MNSVDEPILLEYFYSSSIAKTWNALTVLEEMKLWYFDNIDSFYPEPGNESRFVVEVEDRRFTHCWKVTEVVAGRKITYSWNYEEYPGDSLVTFELSQERELVKLSLSIVTTESFPAEIPEFRRESCIAGWNYFLGGNLKNYLETE